MYPPSEKPGPEVASESSEYSPAERSLLLRLAHCSIEAALEDRDLDLVSPSQHLAEFRGAFTTLHLDGRLRGCIGYVFPTEPLYQTVAETAKAAAFDDPRFGPVTLTESAALKIEISVLSPLRSVAPEEVVVGNHGLVVKQGNRRGLLLPQVPVEWDWNRDTFLTQTCLKAGLDPDAWQHGAELQAFTAEVFGEE
jgi:AmmeMemoRadiSam system protein A